MYDDNEARRITAAEASNAGLATMIEDAGSDGDNTKKPIYIPMKA